GALGNERGQAGIVQRRQAPGNLGHSGNIVLGFGVTSVFFRSLVLLSRQVLTYARLRRVTWVDGDRLAACSYPRTDRALRELADHGVTLIVNLHERRHAPERLTLYGITQLHLPVPDFTPPSPEQLERGVAVLRQAMQDGTRVAV